MSLAPGRAINVPNFPPPAQPKRTRVGQALQLLASCPNGATDTLLMGGHGLTAEMLTDLIRAGLATAQAEQLVIAGYRTKVMRVRITDAGRWALVPGLTLQCAAVARTSGGQEDDDYYVLADGAVVGRIIQLPRRGAT